MCNVVVVVAATRRRQQQGWPAAAARSLLARIANVHRARRRAAHKFSFARSLARSGGRAQRAGRRARFTATVRPVLGLCRLCAFLCRTLACRSSSSARRLCVVRRAIKAHRHREQRRLPILKRKQRKKETKTTTTTHALCKSEPQPLHRNTESERERERERSQQAKAAAAANGASSSRNSDSGGGGQQPRGSNCALSEWSECASQKCVFVCVCALCKRMAPTDSIILERILLLHCLIFYYSHDYSNLNLGSEDSDLGQFIDTSTRIYWRQINLAFTFAKKQWFGW